MIPPVVRAKIMVNRGYRYLDKISEALQERGITTRTGTPFDKPAISKVMSNDKKEERIEAIIREVYKDEFDEYEAEMARK